MRTRRNITLAAGWNLIGYSGAAAFDIKDATFTPDSTGTAETWSEALENHRIQAYVAYYDSFNTTESERKFKYVANDTTSFSPDDTQLKPNYGYYFYSNGTTGNLTLPSAGGSTSGQEYIWRKLLFSNGTGVLNASRAEDEGWIEACLQVYNTTSGQFDLLCPEGPIYSGKIESIYSWQGVFIKSKYDDMTIIRQN